MKQLEQWVSQHKLPAIRNVWLRFLKYFVLASILGYAQYWILSQADLYTLRTLNNKRSALVLLMLSIMSAKSWGWSFFIAIVASALWGDWQNLRWRSLPKEKSGVNDGIESNSSNGN